MTDVVVKTVLKHQQLYQRCEDKQLRTLFATGKATMSAIARSMRYRKSKSKPGKPPTAYKKTPERPKGGLLRDLVRFLVDKVLKTVIAGPKMAGGQKGSIPVPRLLNEGGTPKRRLLKKTDYKVGDKGPFRPVNGRMAGGVLKTPAQAERANRLVAAENTLREQLNTGKIGGKIAPRPFATVDSPGFQAGLKKILESTAKEPL